MNYILKDFQLLNSSNKLEKIPFISIKNKKAKRLENIEMEKNSDHEVIDGNNLIIIPSVTDLFSNLKTPGQEYKSILDKEISAAVAGGVTNICCHPDTEPVLDEPSLIKDLITKANKIFPINIKPLAAITRNLEGLHISEMKELYDAGAVGFSQGEKSIVNTKVLLRAFEYAKTFEFTLFLRPNDRFLSENTYVDESSIATRLGIKGSSKNTEIIEVLKFISLSKQIGTKIHLSKISCKESLEIIARAKSDNVQVTCDVSINQLLFNNQDIEEYDTNFHLCPPLRSRSNQKAIIDNLENNIIDSICSDHHPVEDDKKCLPFEDSEPGASSLETFIPLIFHLARNNKLNLDNLLTKISYSPYKIINNKDYDFFNNESLDFCIFDSNKNWVASKERLKSSGKNIPFKWEVQGKVVSTFVDGCKIY